MRRLRIGCLLTLILLASEGCASPTPAPPPTLDVVATETAIAAKVLATLAAQATDTPLPTNTPEPTSPSTPIPTDTPVPPTSIPTPTPTSIPKPIPAPTPVIYVVKAGDTLSAIAKLYGVTVEALQEANAISDPRLLQIGQELIIPKGETTVPRGTSTEVKPTSSLLPPAPIPLIPTANTVTGAQPTQKTCCKICTKGKACGNSCIARNKTCHQPPGCACDAY